MEDRAAPKGLISRIQDYTTKDGPGLRTTVFLMGCNLRCRWCANPENLLQEKRTMFFEERCQHCGRCAGATDRSTVCPNGALEDVGSWTSGPELLSRLLRNREFYEIGEGGVTFSGGEPALQKDFTEWMLRALRLERIHTCLDTAADIPEEDFLQTALQADMVLLDIKAMAPELHRRCTGVSNGRILRNAKVLARSHIPLRVRLVIVPGENDDWMDLQQRIGFAAELVRESEEGREGGAGRPESGIDLIRYHTLGVSKYRRLDTPYPLEGHSADDRALSETMEKAFACARSFGVPVTIGG